MITMKTSKGDISIELHQDTTPQTCENFLSYVQEGFYDNTIFHRVIDGFMIQGGGLTADMTSKTTKNPVQNEAKKAKPNKRGTLAMARTMEPHSATAQFFINLVDNTFLNHTGDAPQAFGYCVFGEVTDGMDVVDDIAKVRTGNRMGHADVPEEEVLIYSIEKAS